MSPFEKWSVLTTSLLTTATGIVYMWMRYFMESTDPWAVVNHPLQGWFLKAHILVAPLLVFAVGMIAVRHVWRHFRAGIRHGRRSGLTTGIALAPMVATGYLIQAITAEGWLAAMAISHIGVGLLYTLGLAVHAWLGRRVRKPVRVRPAPPWRELPPDTRAPAP
jgi:hypothetical protein